MKKTILLLMACFCLIGANAAYLKDVPKTLTQPDGTVLHCFASGDEYFNYLHDKNGYTIMQHPQTGFYVYADKQNGKLVATEFVAGRVDPASKNLRPFNLISPEEWTARRNAWQDYDNPVVNRDGLPNHGTLNNISIFIRFSDDAEFTNSYSAIDNMFNDVSENAVSMRSYFRAASYGSIEIPTTFYPGHNGDVIISYQDTYPRSYFQPYNESTNPNGYQDSDRADREFSLLQRAVNYINANYPIPTNLNIDYDNDGYVDNVCFIVRGTTGEWSSLLWPHKWSLYDRTVRINGKRVWTFNFQLADATGYFNTSTMCHEMNHSLGAPDLYHYSYTGPNAVGVWDLMHANATPPQHCGAYMKMKYGHWVDEIPEITQAGTYTLNPISSATPTNIAYKIQSDDPNQYYVLEYRDNTSLFETALPGSGLLVYRIDTRFSGNADYNPSNGIYDEVYIFRPGGSLSENGNLNAAYFSANAGRTEFSSSTSAYPFFTDGTPDYNLRIYDITSAGSTISFKYGTSSDCGAPTNLVASVEDNNVSLSWNAAANAVSYNVYRNGDLIGNTSGTTYPDNNIAYGNYTYFLKSVDANGLLSVASETVTVNVMPENSFIIGEGGVATDNLLPSYSYYNYSLTQQIYTSAELGNAGLISSIAFFNGGETKTRNYDFYLKSTTKSAFSSTSDWEIVSNADKVFSGSVTMVADGWTLIVFDTLFNYDGTSNLVLVADDNSGEYTTSPHMSCRVFDATSQAIRIYSDNTDYNPFSPTSYTGTIMNVKNQLLLVVGEPPVGYDITVSANPPEGGTVGGAGTYNEGTTATVTATANEGYTFVNWTEDGIEVSTEATYSFTVSGDVALVANFTLNSYLVTAAPIPVEGGVVTIGGNCNTDEFFYDFEDGTLQGWTLLQGPDSDSPDNWMHCANYNGTDFSSGHGHNASNGFMLSESFIYYDANSGLDVHPDNYLVSPQIQLGGSINFWAAAVDDNYGAEHFAVAVSTNGNTSVIDFTTVQEWTLLAERTGGTRTINDGIWYEYTVDLGAFSGLGYVAIRHFNCTDQWLLCIDDITVVEGYIGLCSAIYNHGESCTVTATANEGYTFVNWTKDGTEVSTEATYNLTVTEAIALVANFSMNSYEVTATPVPVEGGMVTVDGNCNTDEFFYDFEDGTLQGWTLLQGLNGDSPNNWMHCANYNGNDISAGHGHNASNGFMLSESFVFASNDDEGTPVHPDNYLVSPQIQLGGSISFWATVVDNNYGAEHFAVAVSTNGNDFTTVQEWTLFAERTGGTRTIDDGIWYEYTVDLGAFSGLGYVAIHHFDCFEQWLLCVDDITIVGGYTGLCSGIYNYGESCTVVATANEGYTFVNWTKDEREVSTEATYNFTVTEAMALVANFSMNSYEVTAMPAPVEGGMVTVDGNCNTDEFFYDFEDGTLQGWTLLQGSNGDSPNNWMHCTNYNGNNISAGHGHNASNGFMLSESFVFVSTDDEGTPVHPDNYLVSPQIQLGGSISFWASNADDGFGAEHFAVAVSTSGNSAVSDFTTVQEWTMSAKRTGGTRTIDDGTWYEYTVDLGAFSGMGYVAIHHFDCFEQWMLCVDDITIVGGYTGLCSGVYGHGETCTVLATANEGYTFVNWTEDGEEVSTESEYSFEVTGERNLVANFVVSQTEQTVELSEGWSWWSTNLDITLDQLKAAIGDAVGNNGTATIKSQDGAITYRNGQWKGNGVTSLDIRQMYELKTSVTCEITLTGVQVDPADYEITISNGVNWIGFLPNVSMTLYQAFGTFPVNGDVVKSSNNSAVYRNGKWKGQLTELQPGQGYIYKSAASGDRTFIFPTSAK